MFCLFSQDAKRLETENLEMSEKVQEAEKQMSQMEKLVAEMQELRSKVRKGKSSHVISLKK